MALTTAITIAGNLTKDPELRKLPDGKAVVNVSVAVNNRVFNRDTKEWEDGDAVFWRGAAFGNLAEHIGHSLKKGDRVLIYGSVKANSWTDKDSGVQRTEKEIMIDDLGLSLQFTNVSSSKSAPRQESASEDSWTSQGGMDETPF